MNAPCRRRGVVLSHSTGNANVRAAVEGLLDHGLLRIFCTCLAWDPRWLADQLLPRRLRAQARRRSLPAAILDRCRLRPWREAARLAAASIGSAPIRAASRRWCSIDAVNRDLDAAVARQVLRSAPQAVYAYEDGALRTFRAARAAGILTIYELPIGHWRYHRRLLQEEAARQPAWASTLTILGDGRAKLADKDREIALADRVIVPSDFVRMTLEQAGRAPATVSVLPYGCPPSRTDVREVRKQGPLRLLFVGGLSQRKGLSYLFQAMSRLRGKATLTVIGRRGAAPCPELDRQLAGVRHIDSLPHEGILATMGEHDLLVFPSLFEGCALVVNEALSQGLPVLTTPNAGSSGVLSGPGSAAGILVPIRDDAAIATAVESLHDDRERLQAMSGAALEAARAWPWSAYRARLGTLVQEWIGSRP